MEFVFNVHSDFVFSVMLNGGLPAAAASSQAVGSPGSGSRANWNLVVKLENSETMTQSNVTSAASGEGATVSSAAATGGGSGAVQQSSTALNNSSAQQQPGVMKRKRNLPGMPGKNQQSVGLYFKHVSLGLILDRIMYEIELILFYFKLLHCLIDFCLYCFGQN